MARFQRVAITAYRRSDSGDDTTRWGSVPHDHGELRGGVDYPELKRAVWDQARKYRHPRVLIEEKGSGTQLIPRAQTRGPALYSSL